MTKRLRIPDEPRFVRAFALAVDPGDTLGLLMEIGALGSPDRSASLRLARTGRSSASCAERARPSSAYDRASDQKDWEQAHTSCVLREALAQSDSAAYLAYQVRDNHPPLTQPPSMPKLWPSSAARRTSLAVRRRPWEIEPNDLSLPEWRERVWKLLFAMPDNALPKPSVKPETGAKPCTCNETDSPKALTQEHADWCPAGDHSNERSRES